MQVGLSTSPEMLKQTQLALADGEIEGEQNNGTTGWTRGVEEGG